MVIPKDNQKVESEKLFRTLPEALFVLLYGPETHPHTGESAVMEQVLHGNLFGQVGKEGNAVIGAIVGCCIAQGGHAV